MNPVRTRGEIAIAAVLLALGSAAAHANVYKCSEGGRTVYQGTPCAGQAAEATPHVRSDPDARARNSRVEDLRFQIRQFNQERDRARLTHNAELAATQARTADLPAEQKRLEAVRFSDSWESRRLEMYQRENELHAEMRRLCPGGYSVEEHAPACLSAPEPGK